MNKDAIYKGYLLTKKRFYLWKYKQEYIKSKEKIRGRRWNLRINGKDFKCLKNSQAGSEEFWRNLKEEEKGKYTWVSKTKRKIWIIYTQGFGKYKEDIYI